MSGSAWNLRVVHDGRPMFHIGLGPGRRNGLQQLHRRGPPGILHESPPLYEMLARGAF
ncbi:MAG: hypothetical protein MZV63_65750 [Marinilabiliales bacterium]|nr:hypothetical protein [Marinilabiliales bacterium]